MKKRIYTQLMPCYKYLVIALMSVLLAQNVNAQIINEGFEEPAWNAGFAAASNSSTTSGQIVITNTAATSTMTYINAPGVTATSVNTNPNSGTWWYSKAITNTVAATYTKLDKVHSVTTSIKMSGGGYIITPVTSSAVVSITFWAALANPLIVGVATNTNVAQPSYATSNPTIPANFLNFSSSFPSAAVTSITSYSMSFTGITGPVRIGFFSNTNSIYLDDIVVMQPIGTPPNVTTNAVIVPGITNALISGTITPGTLPLLASGVIWSTSPLTGTSTDTALLTKTWDHPSASGNFTDTASNLSASTTYYTEAYVIGLDNSVYFGGIKTFTTKPLGPPTVGVILGTIYSNKAAVTGNIIDSGGSIISEKGFVWNKTGGATTGNNTGKAYEGSGTLSFSDFVKGLSPSTHYCVRAYAVNGQGTGYSADTCFTTAAAQPTLTAIPGNIDFGENFYAGSPLILSYTLTGSLLDGSAITITAPAGFIIGLTPASLATATPGNTITLTTTNTSNYSGGSLAPTPIYVELPTTAYGTFAGNIIHSGGGVTIAANADMVALTGSVVQSPVDVSNTGTDYWLGFAFEQDMDETTSPYPPFSGNGANMYVYISGAPGTSVTVEMPLLSTPFSQTVTINGQGYAYVTNLPQGDPNDEQNAAGLPDARLYYTGVTNRGIHVYSHSGPISVWLYDYATNNSAGGALIFPTNTWNSNYTVQAYGNSTNDGPPNSFFFVIADQDNTPVYFTPVADIQDSTSCATFSKNAPVIKYPAGVTDTIYLNKGQVFNAMGVVTGGQKGVGVDLSGTIVRTDCDKKIAVFGGNGRCLVSTPVQCTSPGSGSDNMVQQMTPSVAWDTKYFTVPTKTMEHNLYRIYVHNVATNVWINDTTHLTAALLTTAGTHTIPALGGDYTFTNFASGGGYYALETSFPMDIESDQPISITQFITSCNDGGNNPGKLETSSVGNNGGGDPEMIILTGAQQAITNATVYSPMIQDGNTGGAYINIVIPKAGVNTFNLDNLATVDTGSSSYNGIQYGSSTLIPIANAFTPYPNNPNYYWAKFRVGNGTAGAVHTMSSTVPFNGIAYGVAGGESYGFNAGTQVKNLSSIQFTDNPYGGDSSATAVKTCVNNPVKLELALPYNPSQVSKITWNPQQDPRITPNDSMPGAMNGAVAKYDSTILVNGRTFYVYTSPVAYTFLQNGTYRFPVQVYGTFASDCPGEDIENMLIIVGHDQANLTYQSSCGNPVVSFSTDTIAMAGTYILKTVFNFGDGDSSINGNLDSSHTYPPNNTYTAKLTTYNSVGCVSTDSVLVDFSGGLKAGYTKSTNAVCANGSIIFTDNSTASGVSGVPNKWIYDFGDGTIDSTTVTTSGGTITHTFTTPKKDTVTLTVRTTTGCSDVFIDSVAIEATPVAAFTGAEACFGNATLFTDQSTVPNNLGTVDSSFWDFGDSNTLDSLTGQTISHQYGAPGTYTVKLYVKSDGGCTSPTISNPVIVDGLPIAGFTYDVNCVTDIVTLTDTSNANGGTITEWDWNFGDGNILTTTNDSVIHHYYANGNGQSYTITLSVKTKTGCPSNTASLSFGIGASPVASFTVGFATYCAPNSSVTFNNSSTISDGSINAAGYVWYFGDGTDSTLTAPSGPPSAITHIYASAGTYNVTLLAESNKGCTNTSSATPVIVNPQPVATISPNPASTCLNDSLQLNGSGGNLYNWNFGDGTGNSMSQNPKYKWNATNKYGVSLIVTSAVGCPSSPAIDSVTVNGLPSASFTPPVNGLCQASSLDFTDNSTTPASSTISQWNWSFGDGLTSSQQNPSHTYATDGTYTVTLSVINSNSCSSSVFSSPITINPLPKPDFTVAPICIPGAAAQFTDQTTIKGGGSLASWEWHFGDGDSASGGPNITHLYLTGGIYNDTLTVTSAAGCSHDTTKQVTAYNIPTSKDSIVNDTALCSNQPVVLINESNVPSPGYGSISRVDLYWDYINNPSVVVTDTAPVANGTYTHQYPVSATNQVYQVRINAFSGNGCTSIPYDTSITVFAAPNAQFAPLAPVCEEVTPFSLSPYGSDANNLPGSGFYSGNGIENDSITFNPQIAGPGLDSGIVFTYVSTNGCSDTAQQSITIYPTPSINYGGTQYILENDSATLNPVSVTGIGLQYMWTPFLYLNTDTSATPLCKPADSVTYTILVTSPGGCHASTLLFVQVLRDFIVPNTFTPNGDGINDTWVIEELPKYPIQQVDVYDRYGQQVFHSHGYTTPWDGTRNGKMLGAGTYYYIIQLNGVIAPKTGYVTILK